MDTSPITMPPPTQESKAPKTSFFKQLWKILGVTLGVIGVLALFVTSYLSSLEGVQDCQIVDPAQHISAGRSGMLDLAVAEGERVEEEAYLGSIEGAALKEELAKIEQRLASLEVGLPLEYGGYVGATGKKEPLAFSDEALREAQDKETSAREALHAVSLEETKAGVESRRLLHLFHQGKVSSEQVAIAQVAFSMMQSQVAEKRQYFERMSAERAALEKERNRIRSLQAESGLSAVPAEVRIKEYEKLKAQHISLQALYETSVFFAEHPSIVEALHAVPQTRVEQGQPVLTLRPTHNYTLVVKGRVAGSTAKSLRQGARCIVSYDSYDVGGTVVSLVPLEGSWVGALSEKFRWFQVYVEVPISAGIAPDTPFSSSTPVRVSLLKD